MNLTWYQRFRLHKNRLKNKVANLFGIKLKGKTVTLKASVNLDQALTSEEQDFVNRGADAIRRDVDQKFLDSLGQPNQTNSR